MRVAIREREPDTHPSEFGPFRLESLPSGVVILWFHDHDRKVNLLDSRSLDSLQRALAALKLRKMPPRALVLASGKEGQFIAGADVKEFDALTSPQQAEAKAKDAQELFEEIAKLGYPTVAAIDGPCLGGGTELALAFRHRIASDARSTAIGLPEVRLGILPGFGGSQRLPRLVGLPQALNLILTGRSLDCYKARRIGLVDDCLPHERFVQRVVDWTESMLKQSKPPRRKGPPFAERLLGMPPLRGFVLSQARKTALRQTGGHYPAASEIIRVLGATAGKPFNEGLRIERKAVAKLLFTPESINLRRIFSMSEEAKRIPHAPRANPVDFTAVFGAGTMGGEIAYLFTRIGLRVRLRDIKPEPILHSLGHAQSLFAREVKQRRITQAEMERAMDRIEPALDLGGLARVDVVLEAVIEDLGIKQSLLKDVEAQTSDQVVLATNTSSLSVKAMGRSLKRPGRLVGMHFFNPAARMPLVEVIRTDDTDQDALDTVLALTRRIKKTPVLVRDAPGFLVNRVLMPYLSEAVGLVERGCDIPLIDKELKRFGMPMGPLALLDEIGLDVARKVAHVLEEAFGSRIGSTALLDRLAAAGALGKKSGLGFYRYDKSGRDGVNPSLRDLSSKNTTPVPPEEIKNRLIDAMVNEAALALDERVVDRPEDVDLAMVMGTGFPPFRGGLLRYADASGIGGFVERLARRQQEGAASGPCGKLQRMALGNERFYPTRD
ncbi:MAG TPA: 3-hydroxyacyl-CoA dehydrogenase NAD-binding domain-containing protein [Candidatus Eisenbacteria bacterium]|nr:3-hydroxyacyl-CoA dehydrogenase NAD-binding domain-containing protein [Candidatus Eisenbacteria bacterium]